MNTIRKRERGSVDGPDRDAAVENPMECSVQVFVSFAVFAVHAAHSSQPPAMTVYSADSWLATTSGEIM